MKRFPGPFDNLEGEILSGMANLFWWYAWSNRQDELHEDGLEHANLSGAEIASIADDPDDVQRVEVEAHTRKVAKAIEKKNHAKLATLYKHAIAANRKASEDNGTPYSPGERASEDQFGSCLAHMSMGSGVSWFDDNEKFALEVPYFEWAADYVSWPGPKAREALDAWILRSDTDEGDDNTLDFLMEFLDDKGLGPSLHEFLIKKTGGR